MAYTEITDRNSPNFWAGGNTKKAIVIHWWGDPSQNPTAEGVVNWLCNPASQVSAHFVITGTGRKVWQLVNDNDRAWHAAAGNSSTFGLELDPRCRNEDYDVAAEVIADLWRAYGKLPLQPHKRWVNTACPGNYDLGRLQREAEAKFNGTSVPTQPSGDGDVNKIPDQDNYYWRIGQKTMMMIRGREQTRDEFRKTLVGLDVLRALEVLEDDAEADKVQQWQNTGKVAVNDKWQQQIYDRTAERDKAISEKNSAISAAEKLKLEVDAKNIEIKDLRAQLALQSEDTKNLNSLGIALQWFVKRVGLK